MLEIEVIAACLAEILVHWLLVFSLVYLNFIVYILFHVLFILL